MVFFVGCGVIYELRHKQRPVTKFNYLINCHHILRKMSASKLTASLAFKSTVVS